jgi:hypothetical protein
MPLRAPARGRKTMELEIFKEAITKTQALKASQ